MWTGTGIPLEWPRDPGPIQDKPDGIADPTAIQTAPTTETLLKVTSKEPPFTVYTLLCQANPESLLFPHQPCKVIHIISTNEETRAQGD